MKILFTLVVLVCGFTAQAQVQTQATIDWAEIKEQLTGEGLGGWVHGSVAKSQLFVFTWRHPNNFFVNLQLPMVSSSVAIQSEIANLRRHDFVVIKGDIVKNKAPIEHLEIREIVKVDKWTGLGSDLPFEHQAPVDSVLLNDNSAVFKVHATANAGGVLVVEYQDFVLPVYNSRPQEIAHLYRNDIIRLNYKVRDFPVSPPHLEIDYDRPGPFTVLDSILKQHGETVEMEGALVMFPQSPQIKFNVFALRQEDQHKLRRNFTLVNFTNFDLFTALREKLQEVWDLHSESAVYDRNKFINRKILVKVRGTKNVVDPNQANPQILIDDLKNLELEVLP